ncbi:MAG: four helix bundle protein [Candidatus Kerfeldbacteria bacterium]|nr:four helix bundle protein [Candidatus Kerfeldbacteria bacterium]
MTERRYDLEKRSFTLVREVIRFCKELPRTVSNIECHQQVVRSAGSVGANYVEANESLGQKDFLLRIRICRREAKRLSIGGSC